MNFTVTKGRRAQLARGLATYAAIGLTAVSAFAAAAVSPWVESFNNRARLHAGSVAASAGTLYAGLEIVMPKGWKTYWRAPGDAGGIPPEFDWSGSNNLASATVLYPVPQRLIDKTGTTIGYKDHVLFPVRIEATDKTKPVNLRLKANYGVCEKLCVPAEIEASIDILPDAPPSVEISEALKSVPLQSGDDAAPKLAAWRIDRSADKPKLILEVEGAEPGGDAFVDAEGGFYLPVPAHAGSEGSRAIFEVDLTDGVDFEALKGKTVTVTMAGDGGYAETSIKIE